MRVTNAKNMGRTADKSNQIANRAVLLALLVASAPTVNGQSPSEAPIRSQHDGGRQSAGIVPRDASIPFLPGVGTVQSNPYFPQSQPRRSPSVSLNAPLQDPVIDAVVPRRESTQESVECVDAPFAMAVRTNPLFDGFAPAKSKQHLATTSTVTSADNAFGHFIRQSNSALDPSETPEHLIASSAGPAKLTIDADLVQPMVAAVGSGSNVGTAPRFATPIDVLADKASRVMPVTDARDKHQSIKETQPIFFTLSDDTSSLEKTPPAENADSVQSTESSLSDLEESETPSLSKPKVELGEIDENSEDGSIGKKGSETNGDAPLENEKTPLTTVHCPVTLAPVIDFSDNGSVADAKSVPNSVAESIAAPTTNRGVDSKTRSLGSSTEEPPVVRVNPNYKKWLDPTSKTKGADSIKAEQSTDGIIAGNDLDLNLPVDATNIAPSDESEQEIVEPIASLPPKLISPKRKRMAVAVASLPVPVARVDVDGDVAKPTVDSVTHDPSSVPAASVAERPLPTNPDFSVGSQAVARSVENPQRGKNALVATNNGIEKSVLDQLPALPPAELEEAVDAVAVSSEATDSGHTDSVAQHGRTIAQRNAPKKSVLKPSVLKSEGTPANLVASKQNIQTAAKTTTGKRRDPIVLRLCRAQVRSMTIGGELRRVTIDDRDICQAFQAGPNRIKLIGTSTGKTTLTIWADVAPGEPTRTQSFEIDVSDGINESAQEVSERTALLNETIDKAFPRASVVVSRLGGELNVTGRCDTEAEAKQIIRMVRKSCLVPVHDDLKVRQL